MRIQMEDVDFGYKADRPVLHDLNLDLDGPGLYCIIGPNGVGKSTMIKLMLKLLTPTSGRILLDDRDIAEMKPKEIAEHIAYVPVNSEDVFAMTVFETILVGRGDKKELKTSTEDILKVHKVMKALDIEEFSERSFRDLSAGQHQKVAIARGLVQEKEILILDEPTSNLDVKHQLYVTELLKEIAHRKGVMVIMISHNLNITSKYADELIMMEEPGRIRCVGTVNEVITKKNLDEVYGIDSEIVMHEGRPMMLFNQMD